MKKWTLWVVLMLAMVFVVACEDDDSDDADANSDTDSDTDATELEIAGEYEDAWGSAYSFSETEVIVVFPPYEEGGEETTVVASVLSWNADQEYLITDNGDGTFGRYDWTFVGDELFYCQVEYAADSAKTAEANDSADRKSPADAGCGGFGWTLLSPV